MDTPSPRREDDLSDIERRLSGWQPATDQLHADAMLFAAGRAAARRSPAAFIWPAACVFLALQAAALGVWGLTEHAGREELASRLRQAPEARKPAADEPSGPSYQPSSGDYLSMRHALEQDSSDWLSSPAAAGPLAFGAPPARSDILTPRSPEGFVVP
jgi:hypothetical protein